MQAWWWLLVTFHLVYGNEEAFEDAYEREVNQNNSEENLSEDEIQADSYDNLESVLTRRKRSQFVDERDKKQPRFHSWGGKRYRENKDEDMRENQIWTNIPDEFLHLAYYTSFPQYNESKDNDEEYTKGYTKRKNQMPAFSSWGGKRDPEVLDGLEKRSGKYNSIFQQELSKAYSPEQNIKRYPAFNSWAGKRNAAFNSWGGKRNAAFNSWGGKRLAAFNSWGGKRSTVFNSWGGERAASFNSWGGKRTVPVNSWGGKKAAAFNSWGGKRKAAFNSWGGKRNNFENTEDYAKCNKCNEISTFSDGKFHKNNTFLQNNVLNYVQNPYEISEKRNAAFNSWGGKRAAAFNSWGGKRSSKGFILFKKPTFPSSIDRFKDNVNDFSHLIPNDKNQSMQENNEIGFEDKASDDDAYVSATQEYNADIPPSDQNNNGILNKRGTNEYFKMQPRYPGFSSWAGKRNEKESPSKDIINPLISSIATKRNPLFSNWYGHKIPTLQLSNGKRRPAFSSWGGKRSGYKEIIKCFDCPTKPMPGYDILEENDFEEPGQNTQSNEEKHGVREKRDTACVFSCRNKRSDDNVKKTPTFTRMLFQGGVAWPMMMKSLPRGMDFYAWGGKRSL